MLERRLGVSPAQRHGPQLVPGPRVPLPVLLLLEESARFLEFLLGAVVFVALDRLLPAGQVGVRRGGRGAVRLRGSRRTRSWLRRA